MAGDAKKILQGSVHIAFNGDWLGFSEGGPSIEKGADRTDLNVDQLTTPIMTTVTGETFNINFPSVEVSPFILGLALPGSIIEGNRVRIRPASESNPMDMLGWLLIHPVAKGAPTGDKVDLTDPNYDSSGDILLLATPSSEIDTTFEREGMVHISLQFAVTADPLGDLGSWGEPFSTIGPKLAPIALTGAVDEDLSATVTPSDGTDPYSIYVAPIKGFSMDGTTLKFKTSKAGTYSAPVYVRDKDGNTVINIATAVVTAA